jgi:hypothetical protein
MTTRSILLTGAAVVALSLAVSVQGSIRATAASGIFAAISANSNLSSDVIGLDVYNDNKQGVGQIIDILMNPDRQIQAYILSVGGILGIGEHYVAVIPSAVQISFSKTDKTWHASMNATPDQLKDAPEFRYSPRLLAKACINIPQ